MHPVPHLERIIGKPDASRLIVRTNLLPQKPNHADEHMNARHRAGAITPTTAMATEPPNSQMVGDPEGILLKLAPMGMKKQWPVVSALIARPRFVVMGSRKSF